MSYRKNIVNERVERWRREDAAPRLFGQVPGLQSLRLSLKELRGDMSVPGTERTQHVIVARAAARFEIPCCDTKCQEGGYDVTTDIMDSLRKGRERFEGSVSCCGMVGDNPCRCSLVFVASAVYQRQGSP
jgi:hypothetical protein